jgi:NADPH:quinone reductase-like Zn-dependent oxidoreductase
MHAAVVSSFDRPPSYEVVPDPVATNDDESVVEVLAAGLHPRVRSGANGSHYSSTGRLPLVPGVDAVGRTPAGDLVYFVAGDDVGGTMAERAVADGRRSVLLPADADPVSVAGGMNPAMSSWVALRCRVDFEPGQHVLVLGATGNAGQMAVQVATRLGAGRIVGAGRDAERLDALVSLGADNALSLNGEPGEIDERLGAACADIDVVIDYLWGPPAADAMRSLVRHRADRAHPLTWVQVGAVAGPDITLSSEILRAADFRVLGSGQGSVSTADIVSELSALAVEITNGVLFVDAFPARLADVESAWTHGAPPGRRLVLIP